MALETRVSYAQASSGMGIALCVDVKTSRMMGGSSLLLFLSICAFGQSELSVSNPLQGTPAQSAPRGNFTASFNVTPILRQMQVPSSPLSSFFSSEVSVGQQDLISHNVPVGDPSFNIPSDWQDQFYRWQASGYSGLPPSFALYSSDVVEKEVPQSAASEEVEQVIEVFGEGFDGEKPFDEDAFVAEVTAQPGI